MKIEILSEHGYNEAMIGLSLSYNQAIENMPKVVNKLLKRELNSGELQFLEQIAVWIDVTAPRYWWQQFDKYRIGVEDDGNGHKINVPKQSESTMHTILKRELTQADFIEPIYESTLKELNNDIRNKEFIKVKNNLPESFLQRRTLFTNYKTLIGIIRQRKHHKLGEWDLFCNYLIENLEQKHIIDALIVNYEMTKFSKQEMKWIKEYFDLDDFENYEYKHENEKELLEFRKKLKC